MPMNQELLVRITRWIAYVAGGVLLVAVFAVFFGSGSRRGMMSVNQGLGIATPYTGGTMMDNRALYENDESSSIGAPGAVPAPAEKMMAQDAVTLETVTNSSGVVSPDTEKRVVKNGGLSIRVEDAAWSADEIDRIATRLGGFTASRDINDQQVYPLSMMRNFQEELPAKGATGNMRSGTVVIKVPAEKFNEAISAIRGIASVVLNESSSASDVTAQFADLEARIKNKYAEEEAFTKILNTTSGKVSDVLEVTRELARVRGEIEQLETEKKYMESQTDMASITVSLSEDARVGTTTNTWRPWQTVKAAVNTLIAQCRSFVDGVIYFVVSVVPIFLLYLLGVYVLYRIGLGLYRKARG